MQCVQMISMSSNCLQNYLAFAVPNSKPQPFPFPCNYNTFFYSNVIRPEQVCLKLSLVPPLAAAARSKGTEECEEGVTAEAREAVSYYLQQLGVSNEESIEIALNSPKYLTMLIDSVRDLDEFSLWSTTDPLSFKSKVYLMAKQKGDNGMLPFLESIGLTLSSATHLARYLSSNSLFQTLPSLINKVKYVKKIFFANSDDGGLIVRNARQMMMHLSISIDEDVQQTLSFFEKIQARRGGLHLLGSQDASFRHLIESFPRLLLLPKESHMKRLMVFLDDIGVAEGCKRQILLLFPPIIFYDIEKDVRPRLQAILKDGMEGKDFGQMLLKYPWILSRSILQNYENILIFFDDEKVPKISVTQAIKSCPLLLGLSVNKLKLVVDQLRNFGIRNQNLGKVIATSPQLLLQKPQEFHQVVCFLRDLGLDDDIIGRTLGRCPEIFASSIGRTLKRKLNFLMGIGVSRSHLPRIIRKYPEFFVCDIHRALRPRMTYLMHVGLSKREVAPMVCRFSPLLGYSIDEVLKPKHPTKSKSNYRVLNCSTDSNSPSGFGPTDKGKNSATARRQAKGTVRPQRNSSAPQSDDLLNQAPRLNSINDVRKAKSVGSDLQFEERLQAVKRSALQQKKTEEEKAYGAIDYDAPVESRSTTIGLGTKIGVGAAVIVFGLVFALGDFLPSGSVSPTEEIASTGKRIAEDERANLLKTLQQFEATLASSPEDPISLEGAAVTLAELGEYNRASSLLEELIKKKPSDPDVYRLLGEVKYGLKDYEGSAAAFRMSAMVSGTIDFEVLRGLTNALIAAKKPDEAVQMLLASRKSLKEEKTIGSSDGTKNSALKSKSEVDPIQVDLLLGKAYSEWGRVSDAVSVYNQLISTYPDDFRGYLAKGIILKENGNVGDAERMFIQARFFAPENAKSLVDKYSK